MGQSEGTFVARGVGGRVLNSVEVALTGEGRCVGSGARTGDMGGLRRLLVARDGSIASGKVTMDGPCFAVDDFARNHFAGTP